jgi:hypothetical protein
MPHQLEAVFYVREAPEFEFHDGMFHVRQTIGGYRFERVMPPRVFLQSIARAVEVAKQYRRGNVVQLHAASASGKPSK